MSKPPAGKRITDAEPFAARLHFIPRSIRGVQAARVNALRAYYLRAPGWVVLTTIGRRTGLPRETLLPCGRRNGEIVVISTYGWRSDWIRNLRKNPEVRVTRDGAVVPGSAEAVEDLERKRQIVTENPLVIFPFRIVRTIAFGVMRPLTTAFLRRWVTSRPVVVIRT
jgi:deazaflavin-dependent oxidoreductase (nitroreductase family)